MSSSNCFSHWLVLVFLCFQQFLTISGNVKFNFEFVDKDKDILKLTCHGDCSTDKKTVSSISIYNSTSQKVYGLARSGFSPNLPEPSFGEMSFYVAGGVIPNEKTSCHLDLLLVKYGSSRLLELGCNVTTMDKEGVIRVEQALLIIERQGPAAEPYVLSTTNFIIVVVIFGVVLLLAVLFLALWLRGWCRYRRTNPVYRLAPHNNQYQHQFYNEDNPALLDLPKSPSRFSVDKSYDFRYPSSNGLVRNGSSRGDNYVFAQRMGQLPLPPVPPSPNGQRFRHNQSTLKLTYAQPIDAIELDLSQDGDVTSPSQEQTISYFRQNSKPNTDVTSQSSASQATYSHQSSRHSDDVKAVGCENPRVYSRQSSRHSADTYSSIPVKMADV